MDRSPAPDAPADRARFAHARALLALSALDLQGAQHELTAAGPAALLDRPARVLLAEVRFGAGDTDGSRQFAMQQHADAVRLGRIADALAWQRFLVRSGARLGELTELAPQASARSSGGTTTVDAAATLAAFAHVALHLGDANLLHGAARDAAAAAPEADVEARRHLGWVQALRAFADNDPVLAAAYFDRPEWTLGSRADVFDHVAVVRLALLAGRSDIAAGTAARLAAAAERQPGTATLAAAAAHARGLAHDDLDALREAVDLVSGSRRELEHAAALEDLGVLAVARGDREAGVNHLNAAIDRFARAGAHWDTARVRGRLRGVGIRRRLVSGSRHATSGWAALTAAEMAVVERITAGLTNRAAAEQLYLSPHTVSMHLRHVFTKLGISSRVELVRLYTEHNASMASR